MEHTEINIFPLWLCASVFYFIRLPVIPDYFSGVYENVYSLCSL